MAELTIPKNIETVLSFLKPIDEKDEVNNYIVITEFINDLFKKIISLEDENLQNIAKVQTMARRHTEEERNIRKYGGIKLAEDIIKPIDLFKKVLEMPVTSDEVKNYLMGFNMVVNQLDQALTDNGIKVIDVKPGDKFDHNIHNANEAVETDQYKKNEVVQVISNGYKIYERVIIHAVVKVAK